MEKRVENVNKYEKRCVNSSRAQASRDSGQIFQNCKFCAGSHQRGNCPVYGQKCNKCHRKNHFAKCCRQKVDNIQITKKLLKSIQLAAILQQDTDL